MERFVVFLSIASSRIQLNNYFIVLSLGIEAIILVTSKHSYSSMIQIHHKLPTWHADVHCSYNTVHKKRNNLWMYYMKGKFVATFRVNKVTIYITYRLIHKNVCFWDGSTFWFFYTPWIIQGDQKRRKLSRCLLHS